MIRRHQLERVGHARVARQRHRLDDHPRLRPFDLVDLGQLRVDREVAVDDAQTALPRERDRQTRLGDGVHRRRDDRNLDRDSPRQTRLGGDVVGQDAGLGRNEQDVVERQPFLPELPVELQEPLDLSWL